MHSPFRSESDVFRGALLIAAGIAAAVAVGALTDASWGGVIAGLLIGIAIGMAVRAGRGSLPEELEVAAPSEQGPREVHRVLVVANQTVEGPELMREIRQHCARHQRAELLVVSPSMPATRLQLITSDTDAARRDATERLVRSLEALRAEGYAADGVRGDEDPLQAAADALREFPADEIIVSTLPEGRSRWLDRDVVGRLRDRVPLPVTHVVGAAVPEDTAPPNVVTA